VAAIAAVSKDLLTPLGTGRVAGTLTRTVRPAKVLTDPIAAIARPAAAAPALATPSGRLTQPAGHQSAGDQGGSTAAPHQPAVTVGHNPVAHAPVALRFGTASTLDSASSPAAGAVSVASALPRPASPGDAPVLPGAGLMNSGNTANSSTSQFDGSAGALVPGAHQAGPLAPRAGLLPVESAVPLARAEELAAVPD
jgi:hypothetical protein